MNSLTIGIYQTLMRIRPAQLGDVLKKCLGVRRIYVRASTGHIFWVDPVSVFGLALLREQIYERRMTEVLQILLKQGDTFIDIGANEGYFSILASSMVLDGKVYCIEPQRRLQPVLRENIRINSARAISVHSIAMSSQEGRVELFLRPSTNTGASSIFRHWKIGRTRETVPVTTLDAFFAKNAIEKARLMKVDVEGAEELVIRGAQRVLKEQLIDFVALEYHPVIIGRQACCRTHEALKGCGYILARVGSVNIYYRPGLQDMLGYAEDVTLNCEWHG
jgi:FkbM family methyltransferase